MLDLFLCHVSLNKVKGDMEGAQPGMMANLNYYSALFMSY
ncbi:hypothetical protein FACS1894159_11150 [Bacteroidia bacterium]|nr:hypothetical protein FACS1894159_11150 [Bacteroidia bacterium]